MTNHVVNHAVDNVVQRQIYRLVTKEQTEEAAAQLIDINSKIQVNRILLFFGVPKEALSDGSAPTHMLIASHCPCAVGRTCQGTLGAISGLTRPQHFPCSGGKKD